MPPFVPSHATLPLVTDTADLIPIANSASTFAEHEAFKAILLSGASHLDVHTVCSVDVGTTADPVRFPVFVAQQFKL